MNTACQTKKITLTRKVKKNSTAESVNFNENAILRIMFEKKIVNLQVEVIERKES